MTEWPQWGPPLAGAEFDAALDTARSSLEQRLGHLGSVAVTQHDHGGAVGVGIKLHERTGKWRHAVVGESSRVLSDPLGFADAAADKILAWHSRRHPEDVGPGGLMGEEELIR